MYVVLRIKNNLTQTTDFLRLVENLTEKQRNGKVLFGSLITEEIQARIGFIWMQQANQKDWKIPST